MFFFFFFWVEFCVFCFLKIPTTKGQKQDRYRQEREKYCTRVRHLLNTYRTEKDRCKERETSDKLHSSHIKRSKLFLSGIFFRQYFKYLYLMAVWAAAAAAQMSDSELRWVSILDDRRYWSRMTWAVCYWAVVYKPFRAQSISIDWWDDDQWVYDDEGG